jgi:acyl-CoA thioester hydrolase
MAKPEGWRLTPASYPTHTEMQTRFQDLDVNGHLNNVAFASLFENGRVLVNRAVRPWADRPKNERTMVAAVEINYLREGNFPDPVLMCSGVGRVGNSSWTIEQAMFQNGLCIATCDTVVVCRTDGEGKPLRAELRAELESTMTRRGSGFPNP